MSVALGWSDTLNFGLGADGFEPIAFGGVEGELAYRGIRCGDDMPIGELGMLIALG